MFVFRFIHEGNVLDCLFHRILYLIVLSFTFSSYNLPVHSSVISQEGKQSLQNSEVCPSLLEKIEMPQAFEKVGTVDYISPIPEFLQPFVRYYRYPVPVDGLIKNIQLKIGCSQTDKVSYTMVLERLLEVLGDLPKKVLGEVEKIYVVNRDEGSVFDAFTAANAYAMNGSGSGSITIYPISGIYRRISEYNHARLLFIM